MASPPLSTILRRQGADGRWNGAEMYTPKYTASHWSMLLLSEYGVDGSDPRVRHGARHILDIAEVSGAVFFGGRSHSDKNH